MCSILKYICVILQFKEFKIYFTCYVYMLSATIFELMFSLFNQFRSMIQACNEVYSIITGTRFELFFSELSAPKKC